MYDIIPLTADGLHVSHAVNSLTVPPHFIKTHTICQRF